MAAERGPKRSATALKAAVKPRSGRDHTMWKTTAMYAGRDGPARPAVRSWLMRFLVDALF